MRTRQARSALFLAASLISAARLRAQTQPQPPSAALDLQSLKAMLRSPQPITWVFTGDSVTAGDLWTHSARDYYAPVLRASPLGQAARPRHRHQQDRRHPPGLRLAKSNLYPNIVRLMIGMNDSTRGPSVEALFRVNLQNLVGEIRANGAIPILQTTNWKRLDPHRADLPEYNAIIKGVAVREHVIHVDIGSTGTSTALWRTSANGSETQSTRTVLVTLNRRMRCSSRSV